MNKDKHTHGEFPESANHQVGMKVPEGYFDESRKRILDAVLEEEVPVIHLSRARQRVRWMVAASVIVLFGLGYAALNYSSAPIDYLAIEEELFVEGLLIDQEEALIGSVFYENGELDAYLDEYVDASLFAEFAEPEEQDLLIESLLLDDSEVDDFLDDNLIEQSL